MARKKIIKILLVVAVVGLVYFAKVQGYLSLLTLENLKAQQDSLRLLIAEKPLFYRSAYFIIYVLVTALSIPGATIMTLAGGALFGLFEGTLIVSFASTLGATSAFLLSRFFLKDWVEKKYKSRIQSIQDGFKKDGAFFLFSMRLVPVFPFFLINLLTALTPMKVITFYLVSQIGMLPGTIAYVNAGTELSQINSLSGILSPSLIAAFAFLGLLPLISKFILSFLKSRKVYKAFKKPKTFDYNVLVVGAGSAGLVTSYIAAAVKAKVALIEKHKMGGDCLNTGCVPSKAIIKSAKVAKILKDSSDISRYGVKSSGFEVSFPDVMKRISGVIKEIEPHDSVERYSKLGVECIQGEAKILSPYEVQVNGKTLTTKNIVIATGARPLVPKITGLDKIPFLTSDNVWSLNELPKKLLVLGGGPIGCELAQSFARLGSEVTLVEMAPRLMAREDEEVSQHIEKQFKKEGMHVLTSHKAVEFSAGANGMNTLKCDHNGKDVVLEFDQVLVALGRAANTKGFGLENIGVEVSNKGTLSHDPFLRTKYPNVYVCGDVAGPYQFTHTAAHQAWFAAVNALFSPIVKFKADYRVIPWCTFTDPEVARVGMNESEAKSSNVDFDVTRYGIDDLDRAIADSDAKGFVKVITAKGSDKILGATIVSAHAGDMITEFITAMKYNLGLNKILGTIHIYPTFSEANKYAAGLWKQANKPEALLKWVEKFHTWRRS
ncbi:MAG: FAD-dependent oxidoreductase [Bdellovibrionota bacterium]